MRRGCPHGDAAKKRSNYALKLETINGNSWGTLRGCLKKTAAHVVCIQEHRLHTQAQIDAASRWCLNNGWKSVCSKANTCDDSDEGSGGVAVLDSKDHIGLALAEDLLSPTARCVAAKVDVPGCRRLLVTSAYFRCTAGFKHDNVQCLKPLLRLQRPGLAWPGPTALGADFNTTP